MLKKTVIMLAGILLILGACSDSDRNINSPNYTVYGSGDLITETLDVSSFSSIIVSTVARVNLTQGENQEVALTVDDNVREFIKFTVYNGQFFLNSQDNVNLQDFTLILDVTIPRVESFVINGVCDVFGQNQISGDYLYLDLSGVGYINLNLDYDVVSSQLGGVGNVDLSGSAVNHIANLSGVGNLNAFELVTDSSYVASNSVGNAHVYVNEYLRAMIGGAGSIYYRGHPVVSQTIEGWGRVVDAN
jgi:hypothetical protein